MHITSLLEKADTKDAISIPQELFDEFGERCKSAVKKYFDEEQDKRFRLRMSNVGKPLRQLMLEKTHGRSTFSPTNKVRMLYGYMSEALMVFLLKASGCDVQELDKPVSYEYNGMVLEGTYDVKVNGKIYDIKSASPYSYKNKFKDIFSLRKDDSFGYFAQGYGYSAADNTPFGGWLVIDKSSGEFKELAISPILNKELKNTYVQEIHTKMDYFNQAEPPMPPCTGVTEVGGKKKYSTSCFFCDYKDTVCHPKGK